MEENKPLVSFVINCYNGEKYLKKCFASLLNQTYQNWELIFWDNASIDKSAEIFNTHKDSRFKYFKRDLIHQMICLPTRLDGVYLPEERLKTLVYITLHGLRALTALLGASGLFRDVLERPATLINSIINFALSDGPTHT